MATKLLPSHFATHLPGVIGVTCRCGADDWVLTNIKSRPTPEGHVRLRCKECARVAARDQYKLSDSVKAKRYAYYHGRRIASYVLQLQRWVAVLQASIASDEFKHTAHLESLLTKANAALGKRDDGLALDDYVEVLRQTMLAVHLGYTAATAFSYAGSLPWEDVLAAAYVLNADSRFINPGPGQITYEGVWDESMKRLRPFKAPDWMPTPATVNQGVQL